MCGEGVKGCQEKNHSDDSFQMYGGTPAVVYYSEVEFDEGGNFIKEPLPPPHMLNAVILQGHQLGCKPSMTLTAILPFFTYTD